MRWIALLVVMFVSTAAWAQEAPPAEPAPSPPTPTPAPAPAAEQAASLDSPRATMVAFLGGMGHVRTGDDAAWPAVFATLDTSWVAEPARQEAAFALLESLDKLGTVDEAALPDADDVQRTGITRYTYFPAAAEQAWVWEELRAFNRFPNGSIELERGRDGLWRFSRQTVGRATQLAESLRPLPPKHFTEAVEEEDASNVVLNVLGPTFALTRWWGWIALLGSIFAGLTAGKIAKTVFVRLGERFRHRRALVRAVAVEAMGNPASLALLTLGLHVGLVLFVHLGDTSRFVFQVLRFLYLLAIGWGVFNLVAVVEMSLARLTSKTATKLDDMVVPLVRRALRIFIVVCFTLFVAQNVFGLDITGWIAGLGIAGLAVSLAAQDSIKNLFGWATVLFDRPFAVGDFVNYEGTMGTVEEIGFRSTRLRMVNGAVYTVPNMKWIDSSVQNVSARGAIRRDLNVGITYDTKPDKIEEAVRIVEDVLTNDPEVVEGGRFDLETQRPQANFDDFTADSLNIKVFYWWRFDGDPARTYNAYLRHCQLVNLKLYRAFEAAGIEFAFRTQTVFLANDPKRHFEVAVTQPAV